jgi:hypothetical protein
LLIATRWFSWQSALRQLFQNRIPCDNFLFTY